MKAAIYQGVGQIEIADVPEPSVSPEYPVKIKVDACAICGTDVRTYRHGKHNVIPPQVLGHEVSGTVVDKLDSVHSLNIGDRVAMSAVVSCGECYYCSRGMQNRCVEWTAIGYEHPGAFAEYMAIPSRLIEFEGVNRVSEKTPATAACLCEPLACCINGQELSRVALGDSVLIIGGGPIGVLHVGLAKVMGSTKVMVSERSDFRREMAAKFGADVAIDPNAEDLKERVLEETGGMGADVIIVAAPNGKAQEEALGLAAKRGRINFFGGLPKDNPNITIDANVVHYRELFLHGSADSTPRQNQIALQLIDSGRIPAGDLVTHTLPLDEIVEGIGIVERREGMKVVIQPSS
ncbi:MAG: zinc-dependent dehydrogenase [Armatimonadetes bacterium]|nr:zinc-dependent dehydrogenase [Armatimonadota bacterium]